MSIRTLLPFLVLSAAVAALGCYGPTQPSGDRPRPPRSTGPMKEFRPVMVLVEPMAPLTDVPIKTAKEASGTLHPTELVLGVVVEGKARAYPINVLTGPFREIFNEELGGKAIAATW